MKFIHISDFHLVAPGEKLWGLDPAARLDRCLDDIATWHDDAGFCAITGDLANAGDPAAYGWLAERLSSFPLKCLIIPGNHDEREALAEAFPDAGRHPNGYVQ